MFDVAVAGYDQEGATRVTDFYYVRTDVLFRHTSIRRAVRRQLGERTSVHLSLHL